jgi:hypothetical protein
MRVVFASARFAICDKTRHVHVLLHGSPLKVLWAIVRRVFVQMNNNMRFILSWPVESLAHKPVNLHVPIKPVLNAHINMTGGLG